MGEKAKANHRFHCLFLAIAWTAISMKAKPKVKASSISKRTINSRARENSQEKGVGRARPRARAKAKAKASSRKKVQHGRSTSFESMILFTIFVFTVAFAGPGMHFEGFKGQSTKTQAGALVRRLA